jgi:hypothetical protein
MSKNEKKINIKVKALLMHAIKAYEEVDLQFHSFITWALHEDEWTINKPRLLCAAQNRLRVSLNKRLNRLQRGLKVPENIRTVS